MSAPDGVHLSSLYNGQQRRTAHEVVRDTLRHAILSGSLPGGSRLVQADIAAQLNVSTTPVREALRDLTSDGLVQFDPHRGAVVYKIDMNELKEIYEIRKALESLAIRMAAARITKAQLGEAAALQRKMVKEKDPAVWVTENWKFHSLLEEAANSSRLAGLVKNIQGTAALYVAHSVKLNPKRIQAGNAEHLAILDAMRNGDADKAADILRQHLDRTLEAILGDSDRVDKRAGAPATSRRTTGSRRSLPR